MTFAKTSLLLAGAMILSIAAGPAGAADTKGADKAAIEEIVRNYLLANPEIIEEAMQALEKKKAEEAAAARKAVISEKSGILFNSTRQAVLGNPNGEVTLVEFFDYNCGYCKRAYNDMTTLLTEDKSIRWVMKEFPVLGQGSVEAARVASAVSRMAPEKYPEFHKKLLLGRGEANAVKALDVAVDIGLDRKAVEAEAASQATTDAIEESYALANGLGLTGTPSYIVGETVIPGAVGYDRLKARLADARNCGQTRC